MRGDEKPDMYVRFSHSRAAPAAVRDALRAHFGDDPVGQDVALIASELVSNVVRHTGDGGSLHLFDGPVILVEVHDSDSTEPTMQPQPGTDGGFGLRLIDALAERWGCDRTATGKRVWATLKRNSVPVTR